MRKPRICLLDRPLAHDAACVDERLTSGLVASVNDQWGNLERHTLIAQSGIILCEKIRLRIVPSMMSL